MKPLLRTAIGSLALAAFLPLATPALAADYSASLSVTPKSYSGKCPHKFTFNGVVRANRAGRVQIRFIRSDGGNAPVQTLNFASPGVKKVSTTWTLGGPGMNYNGWQAIEILYPQKSTSNKAAFALKCAGRGEAAPGRPRKPDLVIRSFGLKRWGACKPHSAVMTFEVTVANIGKAPSPSSASLGDKALVQVMENSGSGPWGNGAMLPAIPPGGSATVQVPVYYLMANPGHMTADAPHKFSAVADPLRLVAEQDEYNNRSKPIQTGAPKGCPRPGGGGKPGGPAVKIPAGKLKPLDVACKGAKPRLAYNGSEPYAGGVRHRLTVKNWKAFCPAMFKPAPNLPPCGANANSSRTWVDIHNGQTGARIYGFCAFGRPQDLTRLWFAVPKGRKKPKTVYVVITDRAANKRYGSNRVRIP